MKRLEFKPMYLSSILLFFIFSFSNSLAQVNNAIELSNENFLEHGDFVYLGSPDYGFTNKLTVAAWFKWNADPQTVLTTNHESEGRYANIVTLDRHNALNQGGQFWLQHSRDNSKYQFDVRTTSDKKSVQTSTISNSLDEGRWYFLVGVYDGDASQSLKIYLNGLLEESDNELSGNINTYNLNDRLSIGRVPSGYRLFTGDIDEVRIWRGALTQDEIRQQMYSKETVKSSDLVSYWNMDANTGTTVDDSGPQNADGVFYSSLVDVHSLTTNPAYTISDNDKIWGINSWAGLPIKTIAGNGVDETNIVLSNSSYILTLQSSWLTTPILDGLSNMTWYGIEDPAESSQWVLSTSPVSGNTSFVNTATPVSVGPDGGQIVVDITSTPSSTNNLCVYQTGSISEQATTGEIFPNGITKRSNIVWGINEWGSVTANILIDYSSVGGITEASSIKLLRRVRDTNTWTEVVPTSRDNALKTFTLQDQSAFYEYSLGADETNPLPVELSSFTASIIGSAVKLNWQTATEVNNYGFEVERSGIKGNWEKLGFVNGNGNSNSEKTYSYADKSIADGKYDYRLKQIDNDGQFKYSKTISVNFKSIEKFELGQNYPNPFNPTTTISFFLPEAGNVKLTLFNILGQELSTLVNEIKESGVHTIIFDASYLNSGMYIYKIEVGTFIQTRKMTLIK